MSRDIKFRAWEKAKKRMIYQDRYNRGDDWYSKLAIEFDGNLIEYTQQSYYPSIYTELSGFELMQFTGLKDKNGKEIYENHEVKAQLGGLDYVKGFVEFHNGCFCVGDIPFNVLSEFEIVGDKHLNNISKEI